MFLLPSKQIYIYFKTYFRQFHIDDRHETKCTSGNNNFKLSALKSPLQVIFQSSQKYNLSITVKCCFVKVMAMEKIRVFLLLVGMLQFLSKNSSFGIEIDTMFSALFHKVKGESCD